MDLQDLQNRVQNMTAPIYYSAEQTDRYDVGVWTGRIPECIHENNLLSLRVFNSSREVRLSRTDIGQATFYLRDTQGYEDRYEYYHEWQWLDVNTAVSRDTHLVTMGGGAYDFPLAMPYEDHHHPAVQIRYYLSSQEDTGLTYITDWRCMTFAVRGENER